MRGIASVLGVTFAGSAKPAAAEPETPSEADQPVPKRKYNVVPFDRLPVVIQQRVADRAKQKKKNGNQ